MSLSGNAETSPPHVAGSFYPAAKSELTYQVANFLSNVPAKEIKGEIIALIVPHAGYPFSGQVAAYAYKELAGRAFDRVVLIGASHRLSFDHLAVPSYGRFATPLGELPVDQEFISRLVKLSGRIKIDNAPFDKDDNALEVQLPFLQTVLKETKIVPVFFGNISLANCQALAYALSLLVDDRTLIIASSDL
ncbi:MAG TPA: AmmeMemoRadiSam system protein B, partial [Candidatus Sulfotelmatobacter sp.]|nr:AmmeMemoRadiSam system protein B [Candidatus Sulfotelmatobacter sp.]